MGSYGNKAYLSCGRPVTEEIKTAIETSMKELAKERLDVVEANGYETALSKDEYTWGSNLDTLNNGLHLYDGYRLTNDERYLNAAIAQLHYILGRNPMGVSYVTGFGTNPVKRPHHRPSGFVGKAMPGMLSGGPCS